MRYKTRLILLQTINQIPLVANEGDKGYVSGFQTCLPQAGPKNTRTGITNPSSSSEL